MPKPAPFLSSPANTPLSQTTTIKNTLLSISQILHLTHHRNKNQHRLAKWYKQLSILRRNISKLLSEIEILETAEKFGGKGGGGKGEKYVKDAEMVIERRVMFLEEEVMGRCFIAFSTVVKDIQYSSLGLVLLAILAEIKAVIRPLGPDLVNEEEKEEKEEEDSEEEVQKDAESSRADETMQDLGEIVKREELELDLPVLEEEEIEEEAAVVLKIPRVKKVKSELGAGLEGGSESQPRKKSKEEKKKKKRKRGDAFDDLFDSLI